MAARTMSLCSNVFLNSFRNFRHIPKTNDLARHFVSFRKYGDGMKTWRRYRLIYLGIGVSFAGAAVAMKHPLLDDPSVTSAASKEHKKFKPIRQIRSDTDNSGLKLTLFQYQSCPFCCKVRSYLDFYGFSYDVVEVNSVWQTEVKWSKYKKVPILVCDGGEENTYLQLNDSSLIISIIESFLVDRSVSVEQLVTFYPTLESENSRGKKVLEYPNKYFIMYGNSKTIPASRDDERKWRMWVDDVLVHTLSPNIYRTPGESVQSFKYFSEVGNWPNAFNVFERAIIIYVGAAVMYFVGKMLKKRHSLNDDVRQSMYDACNEWMKAMDKRRTPFMGGDKPNLADLSAFGVLSAIEGCAAFEDLVRNTNISHWYKATKKAIEQNAGKPQ